MIVADDAFALKPFLMKPYPQKNLDLARRVYNYRHSRARRISENVFGILANRWRILKSPIALVPEKVQSVAMAMITLHNWLRSGPSCHDYMPPGLVEQEDTESGCILPGSWRSDGNMASLFPLSPQIAVNNSTEYAKWTREEFKEYFCQEGAYPGSEGYAWKYRCIVMKSLAD